MESVYNQSNICLQLNWAKLAIASNLSLIIQETTAANHSKSHICCTLHRQKCTFHFYICDEEPSCSKGTQPQCNQLSCAQWQRLIQTDSNTLTVWPHL